MADVIAVMHKGRLQQLAPPAEIYARPANLFVATFCGSPPMNVLAGDVVDGRFCRPSGHVAMPVGGHRGPAKLGFRPEHAELVEPSSSGSLAGEVYVVELLGNETLVTVKTGDALVNIRQPADFSIPIGAPCGVRPITRHLHLFDAETGEALKTGLANAA